MTPSQPDSDAVGAPSSDATVSLREITEANYAEFLRLMVAPEQRAHVANNATSFAQALFHDEAFFRGVYAGETPVGFMMLECWPKLGEVGLWRFMIDARYQRRGYGRQAIERIVELVRDRFDYTNRLLVSHAPVEGHPGPFYERVGFTYTGDVHDGEPVMERPLQRE